MKERRKPTDSPVSVPGFLAGIWTQVIPIVMPQNQSLDHNIRYVQKLGETQIGLILRNLGLFIRAWVRVCISVLACTLVRVRGGTFVYICVRVCVVACVHASVSMCVLCVRAKMICVWAVALEQQLLID
jgi:hypothetical protein